MNDRDRSYSSHESHRSYPTGSVKQGVAYASIGHRDHRGVPADNGGRRLGCGEDGLPEPGILLPGGQEPAVVDDRRRPRLQRRRYLRHDVVRHGAVRLRRQRRLAAVGLAPVQRDLPHGLPRDLGPAVERPDRRRVDADAVRQEPRRRVGLHQHRGLRHRERHSLPDDGLQGDRQVRRVVHSPLDARPIGGFAAVGTVARRLLRDHHHVRHRHLLRRRRHVQRRDERSDPVHADRGRSGHYRRCRHAADHAGTNRGRRARELGSPVLRLAARRRLVQPDSSAQ